MPSEVRFTRAQRWDLVRISAAAVASTVFFTVPMFLVRPNHSATHIEAPAAPPRDIALASSFEPASRSTVENAVSVVTSTEFAAVTTPSLQGTTGTQLRSVKPPQIRVHANTPEPPRSLSRRLGRFLAGNGKYNVKPFPSLNSSGS